MQNSISRSAYNFIIGSCLTWGFMLSWLLAKTIDPMVVINGGWTFLIGYIVAVVVGIGMVHASNNPVISFIGFNIIVIPMGTVLGAAISVVDPAIVHEAVLLTALITGVMMIMATLFPQSCLGLGRALFVALIALIVAHLVVYFMDYEVGSLLSYLGAGLFSLFIAYDWARAQNEPATVDNAIDSAAGLFISIMNLLFNLLDILNSD
ncbi:TPA: hypothetical protein I7730_00735 [Vibrio vulnificus]|uniref:Bax inhibitor-1/YccA family protein n=1 Tax=Vibrio vulnificus TaxID=672 RepID=A0A8H9K581_VIBVL|nr:US12 family protein [Vibrio vulnificus]HAS8538325.1 hypothetical protein [Vibrio vulnificus]